MMYLQQKDVVEKWGQVKNDRILLLLLFIDDELKRFVNIMNIVNIYYDEMFLRFMIGKVINVDVFVKIFKQMKIDEVIKIYQ